MKKLVSAAIAALILAVAPESQAQQTDSETIRFPNYTVNLTNKAKTPGIYDLKAGPLVMDILTRGGGAISEGKSFWIFEGKGNQCKRDKNRVVINKVLSNPAGLKFADATNEIEFTENQISVKLTLKACRDFKFSYLFNLGDCLFFRKPEVFGANVEAIYHLSMKKASGIVPQVATKDNWGLGGNFMEYSLIKDDIMMTISSEDGILSVFNGRNLEITVLPKAKKHEWEIKKDEERTVSYKIKIQKI